MTLSHGSLELILLPELAVWVPEHRLMLISDVHLGKGAFFRSHGIPVPDGAFVDDVQRMTHLVKHYNANLCVVGDLVHAGRNEEWERFGTARSTWAASVTLVAGNHDTYARNHAEELGITVVEEMMLGNVRLQHHPELHHPEQHQAEQHQAERQTHQICGHLHPSITLHGPARQRVRSRCFHLQASTSTLVLPGFGRFTGTHPVEPAPRDRIFIPVGQNVVEVPTELLPR